MRRAEADTCYAYSRCHNGEIFYSIRKVGEVGVNWYEDEIYTISSICIDNEDAEWIGVVAKRIDGDKLIMRKDYDRLKKMVDNGKIEIVDLLKKVGLKRNRELQVGDYIFSHTSAETGDEWDYDSSTCYKILEIYDDGYRARVLLHIDKYFLRYEEIVQDYRDDYEKEWLENALLINEEQYFKAIAAALDIKEKVIEKIRKLL